MNPAPTIQRRRLLVMVRLITWSVVGVPVFAAIARQPALLGHGFILGWLGAYAAFLLCDLFASPPWDAPRSAARTRALLVIQTVAALVANALIPTPFAGISLGGILLVIVAGHLPYVLAIAPALVWIALQSLALLVIYRFAAEWPWGICTVATGAYFAFQLFAVFVSHTASSEARARQELADAHARLIEAQRQLASTAALAERARLWRELHDIMGHHLAAMSLSLEAAANLSDGRARELIRQCRGLTRVMLADIRSVLSDAEATPVNLRAALTEISHGAPGLAISVRIEGELPPLSDAQSRALVRVVQEAITNASKHGAAASVMVRVDAAPASVTMTVRDDGRGCEPSEVESAGGDGLRNMRGRIEELGGTFSVASAPGHGLTVTAVLPIASSQAHGAEAAA